MMKHSLFSATIFLTLLVGWCSSPAQPAPAAGFSIRQSGVIDFGDLYIEVNYYDSNWTIAQQHDKFTPATQPTSEPIDSKAPRIFDGTLNTAQGPAHFVEQVATVANGIDLVAKLSSDKPLATNELSMTFILPQKTFGGKTIKVDGADLKLPSEAPAKGSARIDEVKTAKQVEIPTPAGAMTISGDFHFLIQDDREWGDPRYSMRLYFTPGSGEITTSSIALKIRVDKN